MISVFTFCACAKKEVAQKQNSSASATQKAQQNTSNQDTAKKGIRVILDTTMQDTTIILK